ncbi:unnamed protein product [Ceratitis capitata]|uniref:(Mediterranean fruit fly) hypothetical protein n=1 Tax=Ceratitis capitata TaxID=7213 RepID=A0A811UQC1_CERCA|nr:unnamed protein product [Ceratitis capitata]
MDGAQQNMYRQIPSGKNTPNDPQAQKRLWDEKALNLNSFYGPNKTAESLRTGGGSFSDEKLSEFEEQTLSAFGMSAVNGLECASFGLPGKFTTPATPSPLSEEEAYLIEETLIESPTELTVDSIVSNIAAASDALPSIAPTTSGQQKVTKDAI